MKNETEPVIDAEQSIDTSFESCHEFLCEVSWQKKKKDLKELSLNIVFSFVLSVRAKILF